MARTAKVYPIVRAEFDFPGKRWAWGVQSNDGLLVAVYPDYHYARKVVDDYKLYLGRNYRLVKVFPLVSEGVR